VAAHRRDVDYRLKREVRAALSEKKIDELIEQGVQHRLELAASFGKNGKEARSIDLT
jgi:hypothetical protein